MLELDVKPESSLGTEKWQFILGMPFSQAVYIIQKQCTAIKRAEVQYCDSHPFTIDLVLNLTDDGVRLIFDAYSQTLKIIEVYNLSKVKLKYCGVVFSTPQGLASINQIDQSFGPTHPGVYDSTQQLFLLNFRGLSFSFTIDSKFQPDYTHGLGSLQFPNGAAPKVSRVCIYSGNNLAETKAPALPLSSFRGTVYLEKLDVLSANRQNFGIECHLLMEGCQGNQLDQVKVIPALGRVNFGDSEQTVLSELGCPNKIFIKSEDKMKIHSPGAQKLIKAKCSDYFFNYFSLGLDILIDARSHCVKKFIFHTNCPGHYNFNVYNRCNFTLTLYIDSLKEPMLVTTFTKWDQIQNVISQQTMSSHDWKPVVMNRASSTNTTNPFGSTFCYGFKSIIFEVLANNYLASVTLCPSEDMSE